MPRNNADFFHGTNRRFAPGDLILPPSLTDAKEPTRAEFGDSWYEDTPHTRDKAYVSTDLEEASLYADRAVRYFGGDAHIYKVSPLDEEDVEHEEYGEHSSKKGFRVVSQVANAKK